MSKIIEIRLHPNDISSSQKILSIAAKKARMNIGDIKEWKILKKSIDARQKAPKFLLRIELYTGKPKENTTSLIATLKDVSKAPEVFIIGAGPAGYFAALELIEQGLRPIVLDRGKDVQKRRRDLRAIQQDGIVNPHSNYCFGEGGAGTYSDGKLYTRSHKRGKIAKALQLFVEHGANQDILIDAHPHIGSNKLPGIISSFRKTITDHGGKVLFDHFVSDIMISNNKIHSIVIDQVGEWSADAVILATGHSARDIYYLLQKKGIKIEPKPFALGVRIEHSQGLIDQIQYGHSPRHENLPASSYKLTAQVGSPNRGVFSFCMCPGGLIVPAATAPGEIVVNGMSLSKRDSPFANSGIVVEVGIEDYMNYKKYGALAGLELQKEVEQKMWASGSGTQDAPALRLVDFVNGKISNNIPRSSYIPGLRPAPLSELLPEYVDKPLKKAMRVYGNKMKGYFTNEAVVIGTESRTSSPVRIPREKETYMHPEVDGFFPCGEGAGYAGGIISAAMDGQNVAQGVRKYFLLKKKL